MCLLVVSLTTPPLPKTDRLRQTTPVPTAAEGFDKAHFSYERTWHLQNQQDQADLAWLIIVVLQPLLIHCAIPCTEMGQLGKGKISPDTEKLIEFTRKACLYQHIAGRFASVENPMRSKLWEQEKWIDAFGAESDEGLQSFEMD